MQRDDVCTDRSRVAQSAATWSIFSDQPQPSGRAPLTRQTRDAFWKGLQDGDVEKVSQVLKPLSATHRDQVLRLPSPAPRAAGQDGSDDEAEALLAEAAAEWRPRLPLCVAVAGGHDGMTAALLALDAQPTLGEVWPKTADDEVEQRPTTPAYWGALYGKVSTLRAIYKRTRSLDDALRALNQAVGASVLAWLVEKGATPDALAPAMLSAVGRDDAPAIRLLVRVGKVSPSLSCLAPGSQVTQCSILSFSVANKLMESASALVDLGAKPCQDVTTKGGHDETYEGLPLMQAAVGGHAGLVGQMLQAAHSDNTSKMHTILSERLGRPEVDYLQAAIGSADPVATYLCMYRNGVRARCVRDAQVLLNAAREAQQDMLYGLVLRQRALVDLEKRGNEPARQAAEQSVASFAEALAQDGQPPHLPLLPHAQAVDWGTETPSRNIIKVWKRWSKDKGQKASKTLTASVARGGPNVLALDQAPFRAGL